VLVSVVIPAYNAIKFIRSAVYSALDQTLDYSKFEVIVIDDGSTDDTAGAAAMIRSMNPGRVKLLLKKNGGPASALNMGIKKAKGDWIKWLSADDMMYSNCLELMMNAVDEKDCIYYSHYNIIDEEGVLIDKFIEPMRPVNDLWKVFFGNGSTSIIHKSVFEKCGLYDEKLPHSEDYEFWLRATQLYGMKMKLIPEFTTKYRRHPDQLTNKVGGSLDKQIKDSIRKSQSEMLHTSS